MKIKKALFAAASIALILSACQSANPAQLSRITPLMTAAQNTIPARFLASAYLAPPCESSAYIRDVTIADGMKIKPGTAFIKKWEIQNTGACGWNKKFALRFASGDSMSGETTFLKKWIPPGGSTVVSVEMVAPQAEGTYTGNWILTNSEKTAFGSYVTVNITVKKKIP